MNDSDLIAKAECARNRSDAAVTGFRVGAALLTENGDVFCGQNQENGVLAPSLCAERVAFAEALNSGKPPLKFKAIAVIGDGSDYCFPCGICRQVMAEYCDDDFIIIAAANPEDYQIFTLGELLPHAFRFKNR